MCTAKGSRGRPQSPLVAPAGVKPLRNKKRPRNMGVDRAEKQLSPSKIKKITKK